MQSTCYTVLMNGGLIFWVFDMDRNAIEEELEVLFDVYCEDDDDPEEDEGRDNDGSEPPFSKMPSHRRGRVGADIVNGRGPPCRSGGRGDFLNFGGLTAAGASFCHRRR